VLILDPTRTGASLKFIQSVVKLKPKKIVYISCFVETQVRDVKQLMHMYDIKEIQPVDMFSYTEHVETVVLLSQKN
ncbi:MAG: 23S rRNA (uracil(1939)-C(5))-methyltransferase RlmD, partial [Acholeplasmataceae bacterium]